MHLIMWPGDPQDKTCPFSLYWHPYGSLSETHDIPPLDIPPCQRSLTSLTNLNSMIQHLNELLECLASCSLLSHSWYNAHYSPEANTYHLLSVLHLHPSLLVSHPHIRTKALPSPHVPPALACDLLLCNPLRLLGR